ncbi:MAG TPA: Holliday junction resolvase RuvX [Candidatus Dormibacteraeota bacterium]|nr:Holliday junction resolvase RuvX [Candidatus Dormibacteraeota bacterium]
MARVLAIDPGAVRVGLALSDPTGTIAQPAGFEPAKPARTLVDRLVARAVAVEARELVVGLPRRLDGGIGPEAAAARELGRQLRERSGLPVIMVDERLTSVAAERALIEMGTRRRQRRERSDEVAASLILRTHLDRKRNRG